MDSIVSRLPEGAAEVMVGEIMEVPGGRKLELMAILRGYMPSGPRSELIPLTDRDKEVLLRDLLDDYMDSTDWLVVVEKHGRLKEFVEVYAINREEYGKNSKCYEESEAWGFGTEVSFEEVVAGFIEGRRALLPSL